jgi:hypothetical protein
MSLYLHQAVSVVAAADSGEPSIEWPMVILILGIGVLAFCVFAGITAFIQENRKLRVVAGQEDALRQLVDRYEQLAEKSMDAQQRVAADVAELRSRTASMEQILRSVE